MPYTLNGVGTWYYGKRNVHRLRNVCSQCSAVGDLESIRERLIATLVSLSGDRSEVSAQRQIETLMVEHRGRSPITQADGSTAWIPIPTT